MNILNVKTIVIALPLLSLALAPSLHSEEVCTKCQVIREENKSKNFNDGFTYYEDYLEGKPQKEIPAKKEEKNGEPLPSK